MSERVAWLTDSHLASIILEGREVEEEVTITKVSTQPAVAAGENFLSTLYRVHVKYQVGQSDSKTIGLIVKIPLEKGLMSDLTPNEVYSVEPQVYKEVLPKMQNLVSYEFGPKSFYCPFENGLIMKDLSIDGYVIVDKYKMFDYAHSESAIKLLAKYHATSVAITRDNPSLLEEIGKERMYVEGKSFSEGYKPLVENCVKMVGNILSETEDCKPLGDYILSKSDEVSKSAVEFCSPKSKGLNVLNHGDLWVNNIMFQYASSSEVSDVKFIDFQFPRFGSPMIDLIFLFWTSIQAEVRKSRREELLRAYLATLNDTLDELKVDCRLTQTELQEDMKRAEDWGVITICFELPMMLSSSDNVINISEVDLSNFQNDEAAKKLFSGKQYRAILPETVRQYMEWVLK